MEFRVIGLCIIVLPALADCVDDHHDQQQQDRMSHTCQDLSANCDSHMLCTTQLLQTCHELKHALHIPGAMANIPQQPDDFFAMRDNQ